MKLSSYSYPFIYFQNQRDSLIESNKELEQKLKLKDLQLQEKEEELFQKIEKVFRLEEDCEKVSSSFVYVNRFFQRVVVAEKILFILETGSKVV